MKLKMTCIYCGVKGGFIPYMRGERVCVPCQDEIREEEMEINNKQDMINWLKRRNKW